MERNLEIENLEKNLSIALDIGEQLLMSGAEIGRCEDTISRIMSAYGAKTTHVFTVTAGIIVTAVAEDGCAVTQLRRVKSSKFNLHKMEKLNQLSRDICKNKPTHDEVAQKLEEIDKCPTYPLYIHIIAYSFISAAFSAFFSGGLENMPAAAITGALLCLVERMFVNLKIDSMFTTCACSFVAGLNNVILIKLGIGVDFASISIGNIMLLIPGIAMTNSIRDMFGGDFISGTSRLFQSMTIAFLVAFGFTFAGMLL